MTDAILAITDGTTRIDLINPSSGFHLVSWNPAITDYKGGGVFQDPPLADWRQLRVGKWDTATEPMELHINGANPNGAAVILQELRQLLEEANQYWTTDWQDSPVWLEARAKCETNTRYALIVKGRLASDRNYFDQPFTGQVATMQNLPLQIERRAWLANQPGTGTATEISNLETFNSVTFGTVDDTGTREPVTGFGELFLSNRRTNQNFTHIFNFDDSGASFSANLLDTIPMTLFPASTAVNDIVYFGIQSSLTDAGPIFAPIVFDLSTAAAATAYSITWEYWNGAWTSLTTSGTQNQFESTGIGAVGFSPPTDQTTTSVNSVTAYWIRARLSSLTGAFTRPVQQNRNPYIANWPYLEVQSTVIPGDITALARMLVWPENATEDTNTSFNNILIGMRSISRGEDFTAYINASDENNPTGITMSALQGAFTASSEAAAGKILQWTPGGTSSNTAVLQITFSAALVLQYYGTHRIFIRARQSGGSVGDMQIRFRIVAVGESGNTNLFVSEYQEVTASVITPLDFEQLTIPTGKILDTEGVFTLRIIIDANIIGTGGDLQLFDLILIPVDEFAVFVSATNTNDAYESEYAELDSIDYPKHHIRSNLKKVADDSFVVPWQSRANQSMIAQANSRIRYWFTFESGDSTINPVAINASVQMEHTSRYLSLRGEQ